MERSRDFSSKEARRMIQEMDSVDQIREFINGDDRTAVIKAAEKRIEDLNRGPKEGQVEKITDTSRDFKGPGVEGKKNYITGNDVIKALREKGYKI